MKYAAVILSTALLTGCVAHKNSYDVAGSKPTTRLLTLTDITGYAKDHWGTDDKRLGQFEDRLREVYPDSANMEPVTLSVLASFAAGIVVDYTKSQLEAEAKKYEAQFTSWDAKPNYWELQMGTNTTIVYQGGKHVTNEVATAGVIPKWAGIEVVRWSNTYPQTNADPAFRLVAAFVPNPDDPRWFNIVPLFFQTRASKSKLLWCQPKLTTTVRISVTASWIGKDLNQTLDKEVGRADWEIAAYDLDTSAPVYFSNNDFPSGHAFIAGVFAAPPASYLDQDMDGKADNLALGQKRATPFKVTVQVTEKDDTKAKQYIERLATFVGEKKGDIQNAAASISK